MKIIRADKMGFCAGVRRAVLTADEALKNNKNGKVYSLGPLIHNGEALKKYEELGLKILKEDEISILNNIDTVVIRAHGVPPVIKEKLKSTGANILDGTCPIVQANQKKCWDFAKEGAVIFFTGDANHGEVIGIEGYARRGAELSSKNLYFTLIKSKEDALKAYDALSEDLKSSKIVLISQTTFSVKIFDEIASELKKLIPSITICRTICPATFDRQDSLDDLCEKVEGVIVIGGKNSANTNRLYDKANLLCSHTALIENASEIPASFFNLNTVGLTAGASTPDYVIDEVESALYKNCR